MQASNCGRRTFFGALAGAAAVLLTGRRPEVTAGPATVLDPDPLVPFCEISPGQWVHVRQSEIDAIQAVATQTAQEHNGQLRLLDRSVPIVVAEGAE